MPQMSPIWWLMMMLLFMTTLLFLMTLVFFYSDYNYNEKLISKSNQFNWSW
uniref:ATP synthase complex subunit 8 n=1 Tax=Cofana yasumatsui TaxID=2741154 RepID=A0A6M8PA80_9HEMI|nr:ATP synthase F0 subunit 8 [Cofana yasumatsui]QKG63358.1 ATP synthase F0 subunit 8 [Cofana yasumatsui]